MNTLDALTALSREFGTADYVNGGGGNASAKDEASLWIKPSGTTLAELSPERCIALDRRALAKLYELEPPAEPAAREALVKDIALGAVRPRGAGRPSVETPVHDAFSATFVVHTHPALVNGMTCSREGAAACRELFPEAAWMDYCSPGYTLAIGMRRLVRAWLARHGSEPGVVFLQNHGIFVAADSPEAVRETTARVLARLREAYRKANVSTALSVEPAAAAAAALPEDAAAWLREQGLPAVEWSPAFRVAEGPLTPDHIVYMKSFPFAGAPARPALAAFLKARGYAPRILVAEPNLWAADTSRKSAALALELALNGALVRQLAAAFGGVRYMTDAAREFIENWEVEAYRRQVAEKG